MKKSDYRSKMEDLFSVRSKFKIVSEDPTSTRLKTLQRYLKKLQKCRKIDRILIQKDSANGRKTSTKHIGFQKLIKSMKIFLLSDQLLTSLVQLIPMLVDIFVNY